MKQKIHRPQHPNWIRVRAPGSPAYQETQTILATHQITTVCREAACPNQSECWQDQTATFMIGGQLCTRGCRFCAVGTAKKPALPDATEPQRVAAAAKALGLNFVVITSVDRDDLPDGGANHWANTILAVRQELPNAGIECLVPDFRGQLDQLDLVLAAKPTVVSHNLETVPSLYKTIRPGAQVEWSLAILERIAQAGFPAKTGLMLGLGETEEELFGLLTQARQRGVEIVTLGQYLQPTPRHAPVKAYIHPEKFTALAETLKKELGFAVVEAGPLVRSSYHAHQHANELQMMLARRQAVA